MPISVFEKLMERARKVGTAACMMLLIGPPVLVAQNEAPNPVRGGGRSASPDGQSP